MIYRLFTLFWLAPISIVPTVICIPLLYSLAIYIATVTSIRPSFRQFFKVILFGLQMSESHAISIFLQFYDSVPYWYYVLKYIRNIRQT